jgi:DNA-binding NarL/FixJ family response regulator
MDLTMPGGMGGKEAIGKLRELDPQVRAVVSSGYSQDPVVADFKKYGFVGVASKPYKLSEISAVLHQVVADRAA